MKLALSPIMKRRPMRFAAGLSVAAVLFVALAALAASGTDNIRLVVRVFRIPKEQSFESAILDAKGKAVPFEVCGDATSAFPRATVFFPTELAANASDGAIAGAILDRVTFGIGPVSARNIRLDELKAFDLALGGNQPRAEARFEEGRGEGRTWNYDVRAELLPPDGARTRVHLRFDVGWSALGGRLGVGMSEDVVSAPFELADGKLLLIGARSSASSGPASGAVYWLAVTAIARER